jgi:hypothetical protein
MNIFRIHQGYRDLGISYGLPVYFVDFGVGVNYNPEQVANRLFTLGLQKGEWVVLRNSPVGERGCGVLISGLKHLGFKVEIEDEGAFGCPGWFPQADRWILWYKEGSSFNYHALRPRQDLLIYKGEDVLSFLTNTKDVQALRAVMVKDRMEVWDTVRGHGEVRVYQKKEEE